MSEITKNQVIEAFRGVEECAGAVNCKKAAEAMCMFFRLDDQETIRTGEGRITSYIQPERPCSSQNQLFCQDKS